MISCAMVDGPATGVFFTTVPLTIVASPMTGGSLIAIAATAGIRVRVGLSIGIRIECLIGINIITLYRVYKHWGQRGLTWQAHCEILEGF